MNFSFSDTVNKNIDLTVWHDTVLMGLKFSQIIMMSLKPAFGIKK